MFGREIGPFRLSPPPDDENGATLADALQWWNENLHLNDELEARNLLEVAAVASNSLTMRRGGDGHVIWLDWEADDEAIAEADEKGEDEPEPVELVERIGAGIDLTPEQRENLELLLS